MAALSTRLTSIRSTTGTAWRRGPDLSREEARSTCELDAITHSIFHGPQFSDVVVSESADALLCWLLSPLSSYPQPTGR
jgi:hypothetical protein